MQCKTDPTSRSSLTVGYTLVNMNYISRRIREITKLSMKNCLFVSGVAVLSRERNTLENVIYRN